MVSIKTQKSINRCIAAIFEVVPKKYPNVDQARAVAREQITGVMLAFMFDEQISISEHTVLKREYLARIREEML